MLGFRPDFKIIKRIYAVGIPSIIMQSITSVMTFGMNKVLSNYSDTAQAVLGAYFKLQSFIFMPVFGLNNGLIPILSYNYGARKRKRMTSTIKYGVIYACTIMVAGIIIMQLIPDVLLTMFKASDTMLAMGSIAMRYHKLKLYFCRLWNYSKLVIAGIRSWSFFHVYFHCKTACCTSACRPHYCKSNKLFKCRLRLVVFPYC